MNKPLSGFADIHYGKSPASVLDEDGDYPVYGTGGIYQRSREALFAGPGIIVARKGSLGRPHFSKGAYWASDTTYAVVPIPPTSPKWLFYQLCNSELEKLNEATGVPSISRDLLAKSKFPNQTPDQQKKIAAILETVDEAIEQTQALIGKYEQVKAGMMQDLFTRGLTPDGKLRPPRDKAPDLYQETPIGWIPKDWKAESLGSVIGKIQSGWSPSCDAEAAAAEQWAILKTTAVVWDGYNPLENKRLPSSLMGRPSIETKADDILITRKGPVDRVGVVVFVPETPDRLMFPDTVFRTTVVETETLLPEFLALSLQSEGVQHFWAQRKIGLAEAQVNLNHGILKKTPFPQPSVEEQILILDRFKSCSSYIHGLKDELQKLSQQKSGLMQDLLTGKVPVKV